MFYTVCRIVYLSLSIVHSSPPRHTSISIYTYFLSLYVWYSLHYAILINHINLAYRFLKTLQIFNYMGVYIYMCIRYNLRDILLYWSTLYINVKAPRLSNETTLINNIDMDSSRQQPIAHLTSAHMWRKKFWWKYVNLKTDIVQGKVASVVW